MTKRMTLATLLLCLTTVPIAPAAQVSGLPGAIGSDGRAGPPAGPTAPPRATTPGEYLIGPEDVLEISVWRNEELSRTVPVRPDGRISLPLLHDVQAASLTTLQLRDVLTRMYGEYLAEVEVSVIVREIHSLKISVLGKVRTPGQYEIRSRTTVLEALAMAEGFDDFAQKDRVVVFRRTTDGWSRYTFDYPSIIGSSGDGNFYLQAGDIVVVP